MEMEMEFLRKLPTPAELKEEYPVSAQVVATKAERDDEIRAIFEGKEDKLILVIGPCSADNEDAVIDYISRLRKVQDKVADKIFMIPRIYTNKPRTIGITFGYFFKHTLRGVLIVTCISTLVCFAFLSGMEQGWIRLFGTSIVSTLTIAITSWFFALTKGEREKTSAFIRKKIYAIKQN